MQGGAIARRYAQALFQLAQEQGSVDRLESELKQVAALMAESPELQAMFEGTSTSGDIKRAKLREAFANMSKTTQNFLCLLVDKHREAYLAAIVEEFARAADRARGILDVEVRSAFELDGEQLGALEAKLKQAGAKAVRFSTKVDPELLGGLVLRVGDRLYDGSIKSQLQRMKQRLVIS